MLTPAVNPPTFTMSVTETLALALDGGALLTTGQSITAQATTLVDMATKLLVALPDSPTVSGTQVVQTVRGPTQLVAGHRYRLTANFTASPSANVWAMELIILAVP